ncbi:hypothetical protein [Bacillus sp. FJAT-50079]|uniref:hypothetical protein n=1 Tax=Bacillus sp. FJAT-50079 TaxID=2833577 RepID=UPI001BC95923|nr:hypothetical protein [Bacillus sp. FJAT-50079]MBS4207810.1 hypothetical protein [Bacillus sp. FJAT-50079]
MRKGLLLLICSFLSLILLVGCGTAKNNNPSDTPDPSTEEKEQASGAEEAPVNDKEADNEEESSEKIRVMEKNISYEINGTSHEDTAFLKESDLQNYSLYVLPEYTLTGEEPGKDVLYLTENDVHFMRIEILPKDVNVEDAIETIKGQLSAVSENVEKITSHGDSDWLSEASIFEANNDEDKVSAYFIPKQDYFVKLTIFSKVNDDYKDPFLKMAETLE